MVGNERYSNKIVIDTWIPKFCGLSFHFEDWKSQIGTSLTQKYDGSQLCELIKYTRMGTLV